MPESLSSRSSSSTSISSGALFWAPPQSPRPWRWKRRCTVLSHRQVVLGVCLFLLCLVALVPSPRRWYRPSSRLALMELGERQFRVMLSRHHRGLKAKIPRSSKADPIKWLAQNGQNRFAEGNASPWTSIPVHGWSSVKPKAALISLVRNSELEGMVQSMRQLEARWNHKYHYPWVFFNEEPFSDEFKVCGLQVLPMMC